MTARQIRWWLARIRGTRDVGALYRMEVDLLAAHPSDQALTRLLDILQLRRQRLERVN